MDFGETLVYVVWDTVYISFRLFLNITHFKIYQLLMILLAGCHAYKQIWSQQFDGKALPPVGCVQN